MAVKMIKPINIRMEKELNERIENYCWSNRVRVSTFIRELLEKEMDRLEKVNGEKDNDKISYDMRRILKALLNMEGSIQIIEHCLMEH